MSTPKEIIEEFDKKFDLFATKWVEAKLKAWRDLLNNK